MLAHLGLQFLREPEDRLRGGVVRVRYSREETKVSPAYSGHRGQNVNQHTQLGEPYHRRQKRGDQEGMYTPKS